MMKTGKTREEPRDDLLCSGGAIGIVHPPRLRSNVSDSQRLLRLGCNRKVDRKPMNCGNAIFVEQTIRPMEKGSRRWEHFLRAHSPTH